MKRTILLLLAVCLSLSLTGCAESAKQEAAPPDGETPVAAAALYRLTKDQLLADYDAMWSAMRENYPFWGVLERSHPEEPDRCEKIIADYRGRLEKIETGSDRTVYQFSGIVAESLYAVCGQVGHVSFINADYFRDLDVYRRYLDEMPELKPWVAVIDRPQVADFYDYYDYLLSLPVEYLEETAPESPENGETHADASVSPDVQEPENLTIEELEAGKAAYIKVNSFDDSFIAGDLPKIQAFLDTVRDDENLIIDIRGNGGGNTAYWEDAFVRPNITEPVKTRLVRLMKDSPLSREFYASYYEGSALNTEELTKDPRLDRMNSSDMAELRWVRALEDTVQPLTGEKQFSGKIWLLVDRGVYSSAEALAVFCKESGFATLVGETTGGSDSGGPILFELPASHILVQFDVEYCLNADGSCNQETGTAPDIGAEDALGEVLSRIAEG